MKPLKRNVARLLGAMVLAASTMAAPVFAQDMPTTAELFALPPGEHFFDTDEAMLAGLLTPIQQVQLSLGTSSATVINQIGATNEAHAGVSGSGSLAILSQSGTNNRAVQAIQGNNSSMLLVQSGSDNDVVQASQGNNNTQVLGVSGTNNDVAYLQVGSDLGGAMSVGGENSAVVALQTPGSSNYMMPSGLSGLKDQVVVIVPGRMYVFHRD